MATTIKLKSGSGAPLAGDLVAAEPAFDLTNKRLYTEDSGGTVIEVGTNPTSLTTGTFTSTGIDDNATSTAITIDSSQNVGIGTSSPSTKLNVEYGALEAASLHELILNANYGSSSNGGGRIGITFSGDPAGTVGAGQKTAGVYGVSTDTTAFTRSMGLVFNTSATDSNSAERMRIDSSGNVGIGTSNATPSNGEGLCIGSGSTITRIDMRNTTTGDATGDGTSLQLNGNNFTIENREAGYVAFSTSLTERMRIDSSGRLFVGTTDTPSSSNVKQVLAKTGDCYLQIASGATGGGLLGQSGANMLFYTYTGAVGSESYAERMRINSTGSLILTGGGGTVTDTHGTASRTNLQLDGSSETIITFSQSGTTRGYLNATSNSFDLVAGTGSKLRLLSNGSGSTAVTLDTSGNLLVGRTDAQSANNVKGCYIDEAGAFIGQRGGAASLFLNRFTSDGDIAVFRRDGTTVGSLSAHGGAVNIGNGISSLAFLPSLDTIHPNGTGSGSDGLTSLGWSNNRFKDLYLSGGAYLGGTGAANHLDDYEEGTWTPITRGTTASGTGTYTRQVGRYTKVGNLVVCQGSIITSAHTGTGDFEIAGFPFTSLNTTNLYGSLAFGFISIALPTDSIMTAVLAPNTTYASAYSSSTAGGAGGVAVPFDSTVDIVFTVSYRAN